MNDQSFNNFLKDTVIRSFEANEWISQELTTLKPCIENNLAQLNTPQIEAFKSLYQSMCQTLHKSVTIQNGQHSSNQKHIYYHKRFGWVLESSDKEKNNLKVYLGKLNLLENTKIKMGHRSYISGPSTLRGGGTFSTGNYCSIGESLYVTTFNDSHPMRHPALINFAKNRRLVEDQLTLDIQYPELQKPSNDICLGNDVWLGRNVRLTSGVTIADGCVIAEGSLVRKNCEAYGIYAGTPAKLIRYRFNKEIIKQLLSLKWWEWSQQKMNQNTLFFETDLTLYTQDLKHIIK